MSVCGISGKNEEQKELIRAVLDKNIDLIVVQGALGSGKTIVVTACALELCIGKTGFDNIVISRPMIPDEGEDIGFLPGDELEKIGPYLSGFHCAAQELDSLSSKMNYYQEMIMGESSDCITTAKSLATVKGASYSHSILILDEAQCATLSQLKKWIGRSSRHSKVVILGDVGQKSNEKNDGFERLIDIAENSGKDFIKVIRLTKVERSRLAEFADGIGS